MSETDAAAGALGTEPTPVAELAAGLGADELNLGRLHALALVGRYDFGAARHVVDVGGGDSALLARVLQASPDARGTVVDSAEGLTGIEDVIPDWRTAAEPGSAFARSALIDVLMMALTCRGSAPCSSGPVCGSPAPSRWRSPAATTR